MKLIWLGILIASSCTHSTCPWHVQYFDTLAQESSSLIEEKHCAHIENCTKRWERIDPNSRIRTLLVDLSVYKIATVEEARALIIGIADEYLQKINFDANIGPYLVNFPLTYKNLEISIRFINNLEEERSLDYVLFDSHFIHYLHQNRSGPLTTLQWETIDQALGNLSYAKSIAPRRED